MNTTSEHRNHERRMRRLARRKGHVLSKSRFNWYGPHYCLATLGDNKVVLYDNDSEHPTLDEIEEYLNGTPDCE